MKGVSAIIATILMLVITIGLAGTAYVYISGMLTGKTSKTIALIDATCDAGSINVVVSNDGTADIASGELQAYVDGTTDPGCNLVAITSHSTDVCTGLTGAAGTLHTVMVLSPTNSGRIQVQC